MDDFETLTVLLFVFFFALVGFIQLLSSLRFFKYGKIINYTGTITDNFSFFSKLGIPGGILLYLFAIVLWISYLKYIGVVMSILFILFSSCSLYWFWHTKEDPLNRFHYGQKVWEDLRDKKKEPK